VFFGVDWVEEEDQRQVRTTHSGSATGDLDHREHEEESSAARKARAAATAAMLPDAARLAMQVAAEEVERAVAEEDVRGEAGKKSKTMVGGSRTNVFICITWIKCASRCKNPRPFLGFFLVHMI
jgi:hypothetical protein